MKVYNSQYYSQVKGIIDIKEQRWKFDKIYPALKVFLTNFDRTKINLIEIGSGSGLFLKNLIHKFKDKDFEITSFEINKASKKYLKKISPNIKIIIGNISNKTSFSAKNFDICIGIDVMEHIPDVIDALQEIKRISRYAIFKIPIEKSFGIKLINLLSFGRYRKNAIETIGHINWFSNQELLQLLKNNFLKIEYFAYSNIGFYQHRKYLSQNKTFRKILLIIWYLASSLLFKISPRTNALIFGDHAIVLVKC